MCYNFVEKKRDTYIEMILGGVVLNAKKIKIVETSTTDLEHVADLWNNGDVMHFVGFPEGLGVTADALEANWLPKVNVDDKTKHYSIYSDELGYCGESFYKITAESKGMLDIKLLPKARGKGIAFQGLKHAIRQAFDLGKAKVVFVDPHKKNRTALKLYKKFGFKALPHPDVNKSETYDYFELTVAAFNRLIDEKMIKE